MVPIFTMDFVALLSGGKDSCYNIHQCIGNGHRLVCLANLSPAKSQDSGNEELHSFMYQSAGSSVIPAYEHCLGVPLMIKEIRGKAINQSMYYDRSSEEDEVEDLMELVQAVVNRFPSIKGVSCGAIVSNYQRLRVENVCERLGLTVLSYLWQKDRQKLLTDLIDDGIDAILVKVAGAGLDPYKHLGKSLRSLHPTLISLHHKYGLDVCGEGGEYESLVLDAPFFIKRIVIEESVIFLDDEDSSVGNLKVKTYRIEDKEGHCVNPILKEPLSSILRKDLLAVFPSNPNHHQALPSEELIAQSPKSLETTPDKILLSSCFEDGLVFTNLFYPEMTSCSGEVHETVRIQVHQVMNKLKDAVGKGSCLQDAVFIHLYINDICWFGTVNEEYCKYFDRHPPSRSCIMAILPKDTYVALDAVYLKGSHNAAMKNQVLRQVLHVKSISDWAPLCIGPYAQCNSLYDHTVSFVAGQIPLNPSSMSLREHCSQDEIAISNVTEACVELQLDLILSARHIAHVLNTQHSNLQCCLTLIVYLNTNHHWNGIISNEYWLSHLKPIIEKMAKSKYCCDNKDDSLSSTCRSDNLFYDDLLNEEQEEWDNDSLQDQQVGPTEGSPVIIFVGVPGLPRNAALEIEGVALKNGVVSNDGHKWSHVNKVIPSINDTCISGRLEFAFYPFCCGNGSILIATLDRSSIDFAQISWMLGSVILQSMHDRKVQLNISSLKCIRIFYLPEVLKDIDRFQSLFRQSLQNLGVTCFGLVCVPCCQLEKDAILNCVFQCMDFDQIETNRWISNV